MMSLEFAGALIYFSTGAGWSKSRTNINRIQPNHQYHLSKIELTVAETRLATQGMRMQIPSIMITWVDCTDLACAEYFPSDFHQCLSKKMFNLLACVLCCTNSSYTGDQTELP
jgi:hypothetical protein